MELLDVLLIAVGVWLLFLLVTGAVNQCATAREALRGSVLATTRRED